MSGSGHQGSYAERTAELLPFQRAFGLLIVSDDTYDAFQDASRGEWLERIVPQVFARHPEWAKEQGEPRVSAVCERIERFSQTYNIEREMHFWQVLDRMMIDPQMLDSITEYQHFALSRRGFSETLRMRRFLDDARNGSITRILNPPEKLEEGDK